MSASDAGGDDRLFRLLGLALAAGTTVSFGVVGLLTLDSVVYGAGAGLLSGIGSYLFVPWLLELSAESEASDDSVSFVELARRTTDDPQLKLLGLGLDAGGIVVIAVGFVLDEANLLVGFGAGLIVALTIYLVASVVFSRA